MDRSEGERPLAPISRENDAHELFMGCSPEEFAARWAHTMACFSYDDYRYRDPALNEWIQRFATIVRTPGKVAQCRRKFLTAQEIQAIEEELASADPF